MKVVVDIYGGDNAPLEIVKGCIEALEIEKELSIIMTGKAGSIFAELDKYSYNKDRVTVVDAPEIVTNDDIPTSVIRNKKDSSLVRALEILKSENDVIGMVTAGSSGAVLSGGVLKVGRIPQIPRPALAPILPTANGKEVCLIDCGANVDCRPEFLASFALMGSSYMKAVYNVENPRVAIVSVGVESKKGNELSKATFQLLEKLPINFVGNMEARDALSGDYDVLVADGFVGNVLLKSVEGTAEMVMKLLKEAIMSSGMAKFGSLFMKKAFKSLKNSMDYNSKGGAPFLGIEKIIVKSHGSSKSKSIKASILQVVKMHQGGLIEGIKAELAKIDA